MDRTLLDVRHERSFLLLARIGMASLFVFSGLEKLTDPAGAAGFAAAFGIPVPQLAIPAAIVIELAGAAALLIPATCRYGAAVLALWAFGLNLWFHRFWAVPPDQWQMMIDNFFHHFVMVGGLLYVVVFGAGRPVTAAHE